jgi:hypothetical protein
MFQAVNREDADAPGRVAAAGGVVARGAGSGPGGAAGELFVFLRLYRHELFDEGFQAKLVSSALWGAGRVEDTFTLMGHALRKALGVIAVLQGRGQAAGTAAAAARAGVPQLAGLQPEGRS